MTFVVQFIRSPRQSGQAQICYLAPGLCRDAPVGCHACSYFSRGPVPMIQTLPTRGVLDRNQRPSPRNPLALVRTIQRVP